MEVHLFQIDKEQIKQNFEKSVVIINKLLNSLIIFCNYSGIFLASKLFIKSVKIAIF